MHAEATASAMGRWVVGDNGSVTRGNVAVVVVGGPPCGS